MEIAIFLIATLIGAIISSVNPAIGITVEFLAIMGELDYLTLKKHWRIDNILFPYMGCSAIATLVLVGIIFGHERGDGNYTNKILEEGGYFAIGEVQEKKTINHRNGNKSYEIIFKDVCDWDGKTKTVSIETKPQQYNTANTGQKYILAKPYQNRSLFIIWNTKPGNDNIELMQEGMFTGKRAQEFKEKVTNPNTGWKLSQWLYSSQGILAVLALILLIMIWANKQDEKITLATYNILILCIYLAAMPDSLITFNSMLMMMCFPSLFMSGQSRLRKSLKKNGGYVTIGELSMTEGRTSTYYVKIKDWHNNEIEFDQNNSQCGKQYYKNKAKAIVVVSLGIERTPLIVTCDPNTVNSFTQSKFIESYEKKSDIEKPESPELREAFMKEIIGQTPIFKL